MKFTRSSSLLPWVIVLLIVLLTAIVRIRFLQMPLERDEGEYAYAGQLLLQGIPPYREAFNMKFPGVYVSYALIMGIFGQTIGGIHLGFLLVNAATIVLVFLLGKRLFGALAGVAAAAAYALLALSLHIFGTQAHATHFVVLPMLAGTLLLLRGRASWGVLFSSGMLFGIAILMKQHGVLFALFGLLLLLREHRTVRKAAIFCAGVALPLVVTAIALWRAGVFGKFWFWTFTYAREYVSESSLSDGVANFSFTFPHVVGQNFLVWILAFAGLLLIWRKKEDRRAAILTTGLLFFSFLAMCPGLYFREHYYVLMLPAIAVLAGAGVRSLQQLTGTSIAIALYAVVLSFSLYEQRDFLFQLNMAAASRRMYGINPFVEAIGVGDYLRAHTSPNGRIVVLGSEPEIYFYAQRHSATGHIYTYGMMEPQPFAETMQKEMIHDIETVRPEYVVLGTVAGTWAMRPDSPRDLITWWNTYSRQHYKKMGVAEVLPSGESDYHWGDIHAYQPTADVVMVVYQRTD